ncbi:hypothetical protein MUK42_06258 [Musa troglodytarum]|uniref:Uncharacterized protein n=1 Tax=Musa troglodytarum TaxID=320322 RepID=A0A9E7KQ31_9LILI|nr:hypothetical protein MUK42_06258 [Musa troglodytarum]
MIAVANIARRRRRLLLCLVILCCIWVFFKLHQGAAAIPVFRRKLGIILSEKLPPAGTDNRFDDNKRRAPSCPDRLHNR